MMNGKTWRAAHTAECRERIEAAMEFDLHDFHRVEFASARMAQHMVNTSAPLAEEEKGEVH